MTTDIEEMTANVSEDLPLTSCANGIVETETKKTERNSIGVPKNSDAIDLDLSVGGVMEDQKPVITPFYPSTLAVTSKTDDAQKRLLADADADEEPIIFFASKPATTTAAPRKTYGSKKRQQNVAFVDVLPSTTLTSPNCAPIAAPDNSDVKSESEDIQFSSSADQDFLPSSSKRPRRDSPSPTSNLSSTSQRLDDEEDPMPLLGPDIPVESNNIDADEKLEVVGDHPVVTPNSSTSTSVNLGESSLITFDLDSLLTGPKIESSVNGVESVLSHRDAGQLQIPQTLTTENGVLVLNGSTIISTPLLNEVHDNGVDDPGAIYIQNLLNADGSASSTTAVVSEPRQIEIKSDSDAGSGSGPGPKEILIDSDDEPEIVFVEEKFSPVATTASRGGGLSGGMLTLSQIPTGLLQKVTPLGLRGRPIFAKSPSTNGGSFSLAQSKYSGNSQLKKSSPANILIPRYFDDVNNYLPHDKFSYMKIRRRKGKAKVLIDRVVSIPSDLFQAQLKDPSDIVGKINLAPFSKRTMNMLEFGGIERVFSLPSEFCRKSARLMSLFNSNLATSTEVDAAEEEVKGIMTAGVVTQTSRVKTIMEEDDAARPAVEASVVVDGGVFLDIKNNVSDVKVATDEGAREGEGISTSQDSHLEAASLTDHQCTKVDDASKNDNGIQDDVLSTDVKQEGSNE